MNIKLSFLKLSQIFDNGLLNWFLSPTILIIYKTCNDAKDCIKMKENETHNK